PDWSGVARTGSRGQGSRPRGDRGRPALAAAGDVRLSLIANPAAGGGRTGRALEGVRQTLTELGLDHHLELTRSLEHARELATAARLVSGNLVYAYGALRALVSWRPATFEVRLDGGQPRRMTGYTVAAANSKAYGGGMLLAPDASLEDGLLDVVMVEDVPKLRLLRLLPTVFKGEHVRQRNVQVLRAAEVQITASRPFTLYADGDPVQQL